jgi:hypothetical protein
MEIEISTCQHSFIKEEMKMSNFSTWLLAIFMVMFWLFRTIVALCSQFSIDLLGIESYNLNFEIIIAFATLFCIILVVKRKLIGSLLYFLMYGTYFGEHLLTNIMPIIQKQTTLTVDMSMNLFSDFIAIILALFVVLDMLVDKGRKANPIDRKTDWYFKNKKYEEELKARDDREDKNEYKFF